MKFYKCDQLLFCLIILIGIIVAAFFYQTHKSLEEKNTIFRQQIVSIYCTSRKVGSEIEINFNSKIYQVNISNLECSNLKNGSYIDLLYNKEFDYFFLPGKSKSNLFQIYILSTAFIISLLPWRKWF